MGIEEHLALLQLQGGHDGAPAAADAHAVLLDGQAGLPHLAGAVRQLDGTHPQARLRGGSQLSGGSGHNRELSLDLRQPPVGSGCNLVVLADTQSTRY